jgi:hypothetical protein
VAPALAQEGVWVISHIQTIQGTPSARRQYTQPLRHTHPKLAAAAAAAAALAAAGTAAEAVVPVVGSSSSKSAAETSVVHSSLFVINVSSSSSSSNNSRNSSSSSNVLVGSTVMAAAGANAKQAADAAVDLNKLPLQQCDRNAAPVEVSSTGIGGDLVSGPSSSSDAPVLTTFSIDEDMYRLIGFLLAVPTAIARLTWASI